MYDNRIATKISRLYKQRPLTDFASVTADTPLESLNLNWRERDLPEYTRTKHVHRLHPYLGKFIPQLAEIFLRKYRPGLVYDPFVGSGTTLVESNALGIDCIGTDISAFNVLLSRAKTSEYDIEKLERETEDILKRLHAEKEGYFGNGPAEVSKETENEYIEKWFAPNAQRELLVYLKLINDYTYQDLLKVVLSRSARSARLVTHYDLDFPKKPQTKPYKCYKHQRTCQPVAEAYKFLFRYTLDTLDRVREFSKIRTKATVQIYHDDSRVATLPKGIDMILTSPPYLGLIDYHEQHRYSYELLGLKNNETKEIGAAKSGQSQQARVDYIKGINDVLLHTRDDMTENALAVLIVNDKHNLYDAKTAGFKEVGRVERHVNRRTGRREGAFYESILIWQKA